MLPSQAKESPPFSLRAPQSLWILLLGVVLRLLLLSLYPPTEWYEDGTIAKNISEGLGFSLIPGVPTAIKAPTYPYFLTMIRLMFANDKSFLAATGYCQLLLFVGSYIYITRLAGLFFSEKAVALTGLLYSLHPSYVYYIRVLEATNLFLVAFPAALFCLLCLQPESKPSDFLFCGAAIGFSIITNPISILPIVLVISYLLVSYPPFRRFRIKNMGLSLLMLVAVTIPWMGRNAFIFGEVIPVKTPFYYTLYVGFEREVGEGREALQETSYSEVSSMMNTGQDRQVERMLKPLLIMHVRRNPGLYMRNCLSRLWQYWWVPRRYLGDHSISFLIGRKLPILFLLLGTIFGLASMRRERNSFLVISLLNFLAFTLIYSLIFAANIRFKLDVEWIQVMVAAHGLAYLASPGGSSGRFRWTHHWSKSGG